MKFSNGRSFCDCPARDTKSSRLKMKSDFPAPIASGFLFQIQVKRAFAFLGGHFPRARSPASFKTMSAIK